MKSGVVFSELSKHALQNKRPASKKRNRSSRINHKWPLSVFLSPIPTPRTLVTLAKTLVNAIRSAWSVKCKMDNTTVKRKANNIGSFLKPCSYQASVYHIKGNIFFEVDFMSVYFVIFLVMFFLHLITYFAISLSLSPPSL